MHLIETYATNCGLKIDKPNIYLSYFPLPFEKYIVLQPFSKPSKNYSYWQEVIDIIFPILQQNNIHIVQIGGANEHKFDKVYYLAGKTNIHQTAYIISNSLLCIGTDSFGLHIAGAYGVKTIGLYGNSNPQNVAPYWYRSHISLKQNLNEKPSYSLDENPKSIDTIPIEDVIDSILKSFDSNARFSFKTEFVGRAYHIKTLEVIPDCLINPNDFGTNSLIIRLDLLSTITQVNYNFLIEQAKHATLNIITNKPIDLNVLNILRQKIISFVYILEETNHSSFVADVIKLGINVQICSFLPPEEITKHKIKYIDIGNIVSIRDEVKVDIDKEYYFKSSKYLISKGKLYPSDFAYKLNYSISNILYDPIKVKLDRETLAKEGKYLWLLTSNQKAA